MGSGEGDLTIEDDKEDREFRLALLNSGTTPKNPNKNESLKLILQSFHVRAKITSPKCQDIIIFFE